MAANIAAIRSNVRNDLHDNDAANYVWTDAVLDRHIGHAVAEYSLYDPLETKSTIAATPNSRDISIASLTPLIAIERVEWPTLQFPPQFVGFSVWGTTLTLDSVAAPTAADNVFIYWLKQHTLDAGSSTIPPSDDDLIAIGAAGFAALDRDAYAINRLNTGGDDVWGRYGTFGNGRLADFRAQLALRGRNNTVRQRRTYATDAPAVFEQSRVKY